MPSEERKNNTGFKVNKYGARLRTEAKGDKSNAMSVWGGVLRDDTKNGCIGDYHVWDSLIPHVSSRSWGEHSCGQQDIRWP